METHPVHQRRRRLRGRHPGGGPRFGTRRPQCLERPVVVVQYVVYLAAGLSLVEFITRRVARGVVTRRRAFFSLVAIRPFVDGGCRENRPPRRRARPPPSLRALHAHPRRRGVVVSSAHAVARHRRRRRGAVRDVGVRRLHLPVPHLPPAHPRVQHLQRGRARRARGGGRRPLAPPPRPRRRSRGGRARLRTTLPRRRARAPDLRRRRPRSSRVRPRRYLPRYLRRLRRRVPQHRPRRPARRALVVVRAPPRSALRRLSATAVNLNARAPASRHSCVTFRRTPRG